MQVISTFTLIYYPDDINLDRTGEWVTVSDRNQTWTSLRKEWLFKEAWSHRTSKLQKCQDAGRPQEWQDQGSSSSSIPFFFYSSYLCMIGFFLLCSQLCSMRKKWTTSAPETFYFMALAASEEINLTQVPRPNVPGEELCVPEPLNTPAVSSVSYKNIAIFEKNRKDSVVRGRGGTGTIGGHCVWPCWIIQLVSVS